MNFSRETWLEIRRGLLLMVGAIERELQVGKYEPKEKSLAPHPRD